MDGALAPRIGHRTPQRETSWTLGKSGSPSISSVDAPHSNMEGNGIRILQDLGPACTSSINTLRSTLGRIMSDGQPGNPGNANPTELARLIHFFAAVSSKPTQDTASSSLSSAFVGVYLNTTEVSATAPSEWNLEVIATVMQVSHTCFHLQIYGA